MCGRYLHREGEKLDTEKKRKTTKAAASVAQLSG
jgi:hypothetical protein